MRLVNMAAEDPLQSPEAVGRYGCLRPDDGGTGRRRRRGEDRHDRRSLSASASHGLEPAGEKGGGDDKRGCLIGHTKGGLNINLHAVTDAKEPAAVLHDGSEYKGVAALQESLPDTEWLIANRRYDARGPERNQCASGARCVTLRPRLHGYNHAGHRRMEVTRHYLDGASGHMAKTVGPTAHIAPETRIACLYSGMADVVR